MRGAPGRLDRHISHVFDSTHYCKGCGAFAGSLHVSIAQPCPMDRVMEAIEKPAEFDWLGSLR